MGFFDAMKGANNSWGTATGSFGVGYIGPKNLVNNTAHELMISSTALKESVVFTKNDVESITLIAATQIWIKFKLKLKNGFESVLTITASDPKQAGGQAIGLSNFEWWLADVLYK